jgi:endonuclease/exonuclease/phosphatase (EEP) superfamily protein YafD
MSFLRSILTLAAAGLVLATAFALAARLWWPFELFSHFRLQYAVTALVLGLAALALRAYPTAAVLAAVALVHGWAIKDLWLGGGGMAGATPMAGVPLRVLSANVLASNPAPDQVLDFILAADADLVVLVDARGERWREVLAKIGVTYPYQAPEARGRDDHTAVILFSRLPILEHRRVRRPGGRESNVLAEIAVGDCTIAVAAVHFISPSPIDAHDTRRRDRGLAYLAESIEGTDRPMIVAGDFNTSPWSPQFRDLLAATELHDAAVGHGYIGTWPRWFWPMRIPIDHILVKGLAVATITRGPAIGSDHFPIVADLRLVGGCSDRAQRGRRALPPGAHAG